MNYYQCLICYETINTEDILKVCPKCGEANPEQLHKMEAIECDKCHKLCGRHVGLELDYWLGPDGSFCSNCVPRRICSCNTFKHKWHGREEGYSKFKRIDNKKWVALDDSGKIYPCVDYF